MSESESEEEESDEEEEEDDDDEEDEGDDDSEDEDNNVKNAERKAAELNLKEKNALDDIALIKDIFSYIDRTSKRIVTNITLEENCRRLQEEHKALEEERDRLREQLKYERNNPRSSAEDCSEEEDEAEGDDEVSLSWSEYEELNDGQRAKLLEKSLQLLSNNEDDGRRGKSKVNSKKQPKKDRRSSSPLHTDRDKNRKS